MFELFDPRGELVIRDGCHLPHWYQPGVTYFVTFRTEDSIPAGIARLWHRRREDWLRRHGVDPRQIDWKALLEKLSVDDQREFHETFSREYLEHLDRGHGACLLKRPQLAEKVADSLEHFDGSRYHLGDYVIMPNHVHLLVCLLGDTEIQSQCRSWKTYTATQINRILGRGGRFWQEESFDHLVRTPEQFEAIQRYIAANPHTARLQEGQYRYRSRK